MRRFLLFLCAATALPAAKLNFADPRSYFVLDIVATAQGDFNGDGKQDFAVVSRYGYVQMFLGNGNGSFRALPTTTPVSGPAAMVAGDFNNDGKLDLAVASLTPNSILVLLGDGKGGFSKTVTTSSTIQPAALAAGDVNNDGILDLVVQNASASGSGFEMFLGKGGGKFSGALIQTSPGGSAQPVLLDVNHDGKLDLTFQYAGVAIGVQLGNGDGTFPYPKYFNLTGALMYTYADFNGDGIPDLAVGVDANEVTSLTIALGNGDGTFTSTGTPIPVSSPPGYLAAGDVNGDGHQDLIVAVGGISVFLGNGAGGFGTPKVFDLGGGTIFMGDYNGDHHLDLALANSDILWVSLGDGQGDFQAPLPTTSPISPASMAAGDVTGDGLADLVILSSTASTQNRGEIAVLKNNGNGAFQPLGVTPVGVKPKNIAIADVNGDGIADLLVGESAPTYNGIGLYVILGQGGGTFQTPVWYGTPSAPLVFLSADLNHDGITDLIVLDGTNVTTLLGAGGGIFQPAQSFPAGVQPVNLVAGDFNGDGNLDLAVSDFGGSALLILSGNGDGTFAAPVTAATVTEIGSLVTGDFNGDGILDLAVTGPPGFMVFLGNGNGTFQAPVTYSTNSGNTLVAADFNGDGHLDLATASFDNEQFYIYLGNGAGAFTSAGAFAIPGGNITLTGLYTADFNGDGKPDVTALGAPLPVILNTSH